MVYCVMVLITTEGAREETMKEITQQAKTHKEL
jgi:hypothetical protein